MILKTIGNINHHVFQTIKTNEFEQGMKYTQEYAKNEYVHINHPKKIINNNNHTIPYFNIILEIEEGHNVIEYSDIKKHFFDSISTDILKSISKKHVILKQDLYNFVYSTQNEIPANHNVMDMICALNKKSFILVKDNFFTTYYDNKYEETYVVFDKQQKNSFFNKYENMDDAKIDLRNMGVIEKKTLKNMKLVELKEFASFNRIDLGSSKKKEDVLELIDKYISHKKKKLI